jgi:CRP/FNR family transcriptional regulator, dissimilatory nitrate respiration regulator
MLGEVVAFLDKPSWPATIEAQEACTVAFVYKDKILGQCENVCDWHNTMIRNMLKILSQRAMMLNRKVDYLTIKSMRAKICTFLLQQYKETGAATFMLPMNRNDLADFLNVSRPSMSRELSRMKDEGMIDFHLSSFRILDLEALKLMIL